MKYVVKDKETKLYFEGRALDGTKDKLAAKVFYSISEVRSEFGKKYKEEVELEPLYLMCRKCKNSKKYTVNKKEFLGCTELVGVFAASAGFIICKNYDPIKND